MTITTIHMPEPEQLSKEPVPENWVPELPDRGGEVVNHPRECRGFPVYGSGGGRVHPRYLPCP